MAANIAHHKWRVSQRWELCLFCFSCQKVLVTIVCLTLCNPMDCSPPGSTVHLEFSRQKYWSGQTFSSPGNLPDPGIKPRSPALQVDSFVWATREEREGNSASLTGPAEAVVELCATMSSYFCHLIWGIREMKPVWRWKDEYYTSTSMFLVELISVWSFIPRPLTLPAKPRAGTSNLSPSCHYHRGWEMSSVKLYFVFRILYLWFEVGPLLSQFLEGL